MGENGDEDESASDLLKVIEYQYRQADEARAKDELVSVSIWTPEGRLEALQFDFQEPDVLIVHGFRMGRRTTYLAPLQQAQVSIETVPLPPEEKARYLGFRRD